MVTAETAIFFPRHIDRLPRPFVRMMTAFVIIMHSVLIVLLLRNIPLAELGSASGNGGGSGASTLYISVLQAPDRQGKAVPASREKTQPVSIEKQAVPHGMKKENTLIATDSVSDRTARAETTLPKDTVRENEPVIKENASTKETRSSASSAIDESRSPETGGGSDHDTKIGPGNGGGNGTGDGARTGDGIGAGGPGSNMARSVPLSRLNYKHAFKPEYPERSIQRNEAGQVSVRVVVGTDGRVHDARIVSSSGFDRLDHAALKAARRSTFHPYSENGRVLAAMAVIPYQFNLKNQ